MDEGGFNNFSVNGSFYLQREVLYKNNPHIEAEKRLNMAYLLLTNPQMIETIEKNKACFFHGTNANALPSILKYGINSANKSIENDIPVTTGEEYSRINNGGRTFVSLTDCLNEALEYANMTPNDNASTNSIFNFGVVIGASFEKTDDIRFCSVNSDISEIGVIGNLPVEHIKFLAVPDDKVEFVKKMVGEKDIDVVSMDIKDIFFINNFSEKLIILEQDKENIDSTESHNPTYCKDDVKTIVNERKPSGIKGFFETLKAKWKSQDDKNISERG